MRNLVLVSVTVLVALALVGCGGLTKEKAEKVIKDYYGAQLKEIKDGKTPAPQALMDKTAKDAGFKDWADFNAKAVKSLGAEGYTKAYTDAGKWYTDECKKWGDEQAKKAGAPAEPKEKEEEKK